jgi:hypothetical protein
LDRSNFAFAISILSPISYYRHLLIALTVTAFLLPPEGGAHDRT